MAQRVVDRLAVFDLDGTLVDTLPAIAEAMNAVLREEGLPEHPRDAYRRFAGDGAEMLVRRATGRAFDAEPRKLRELLMRFREHDVRTDEEFARPYAGVREMLEELRKAGWGVGVLSNKEHAEAEALVAREFGLEGFVEVLGHMEGGPLKPDPTGLLEMLSRARVGKGAVVYVGDTDTDMRTGRGAGVATVGVSWGFREAEELWATGADEVVGRAEELMGVAERLLRERK
ncbi:MAG: HAD family hydrolase [Phycisphaerales bacterium]